MHPSFASQSASQLSAVWLITFPRFSHALFHTRPEQECHPGALPERFTPREKITADTVARDLVMKSCLSTDTPSKLLLRGPGVGGGCYCDQHGREPVLPRQCGMGRPTRRLFDLQRRFVCLTTRHRIIPVLLDSFKGQFDRRGRFRQTRRRRSVMTAPGRRTETATRGVAAGNTWISRTQLPCLLAFIAGFADVASTRTFKMYSNMMTGNIIKLFSASSLADARLTAATIGAFGLGYALHLYADQHRLGFGSPASARPCSRAALIVAVLMFATDCLVDHNRGSEAVDARKWPVVLVAAGSGMINAVSVCRTNLVTNMMTGHLSKICADVADCFAGVATRSQRLSAIVSLRIVACFCAGITGGASLWRLPHPESTRWIFTKIGVMYAVVLLLHETPRRTPG